MLYVIDGTGADSTKTYEQDMSHGFCKKMEREFGGYYERGPNTLDVGKSTAKIADKVHHAIVERLGRSDEPVFLAGHSRGGSAAIRVADKLRDQKIQVRAMFLFDAVDRATDLVFTSRIPDNVAHTYHARRDPSLAHYYEADLRAAEAAWRQCVGRHSRLPNLILDPNIFVYNTVFGDPKKELPSQCEKQTDELRRIKLLDQKMKLAMRTNLVFDLDLIRQRGLDGLSIDFSNTGTIPARSQDQKLTYVEKSFRGSHGAIGGAPIVDDRAPPILRELDGLTMMAVRTWMWSNFAAAGLTAAQSPINRRAAGGGR